MSMGLWGLGLNVVGNLANAYGERQSLKAQQRNNARYQEELALYDQALADYYGDMLEAGPQTVVRPRGIGAGPVSAQARALTAGGMGGPNLMTMARRGDAGLGLWAAGLEGHERTRGMADLASDMDTIRRKAAMLAPIYDAQDRAAGFEGQEWRVAGQGLQGLGGGLISYAAMQQPGATDAPRQRQRLNATINDRLGATYGTLDPRGGMQGYARPYQLPFTSGAGYGR